jgi:hypothetical protein
MSGSKTRLALLLSSLLVSACTVGEIPPRNQQSSGTDAGGATGNGCVDRLAPPVDKHSHDDGGTDNAGQDCTQGGCHMQGAAGTSGKGNKAPEYLYGGTVYKNDQTTPDQGAAITLIAGGVTGTYYTDAGGNFYVMVGDATFPSAIQSGKVASSACPNILQMQTVLSQSGCSNSNGACHLKTGTLQYGSGGKIYVSGD